MLRSYNNIRSNYKFSAYSIMVLYYTNITFRRRHVVMPSISLVRRDKGRPRHRRRPVLTLTWDYPCVLLEDYNDIVQELFAHFGPSLVPSKQINSKQPAPKNRKGVNGTKTPTMSNTNENIDQDGRSRKTREAVQTVNTIKRTTRSTARVVPPEQPVVDEQLDRVLDEDEPTRDPIVPVVDGNNNETQGERKAGEDVEDERNVETDDDDEEEQDYENEEVAENEETAEDEAVVENEQIAEDQEVVEGGNGDNVEANNRAKCMFYTDEEIM